MRDGAKAFVARFVDRHAQSTRLRSRALVFIFAGFVTRYGRKRYSMMCKHVSLKKTQGRLIDKLPHALTSRHHEFLLSRVSAEPAWALMPFTNLQRLAAPQWELINSVQAQGTQSGAVLRST